MHTLLLADDSVTIQRVIELTFADEDIRVVAVGDGGEAIAMLDQAPPDIVLADVGMPGQNGYEVALHVRDTPRLAHIPVVLLTGAFEPIDQARMAEVGCDGVLAKPFEPQLVIARVKELLARVRDTAPKVVAGDEAKAPASPDTEAPSREALDGYFDRLDAAFSNLAPPSVPHDSNPAEPSLKSASDRMDAALDAARAMTTSASDREAARADEAGPWPRAAVERPPDVAPAPPSSRPHTPPPFPPLADAFAALLDAEQAAPAPKRAPAWPVTAEPGRMPAFESAPPTLPDDFVDQVTRRVLDQLSDRVVRETTAEIVSAVAERLVKEEIDRIKRRINS